MFVRFIIPALLLCIAVPYIVFFAGQKTKRRFKLTLGVNLVTFFGVLLFSTIFIFSGQAYAAEATEVATSAEGWKYLAAALSTGLGSIGGGIAVASAASAAVGAISENEAIFGKTLVFVGLAEGIAIYGLLISLLILFL